MSDFKISDYSFDSAERDTIQCLFLNGPTWDGNLPSKRGRTSLIERGYAERNFGYNWLTMAGIEYAVKVMNLDKSRR